MKKLVIFVMAGALLVLGASMVFANPQVDGSTAESANAGNTIDASGSSGTVAVGVGDAAANGSSLYNKETKIWGNTSTKTTTVDESGQTNTKDSNNTKTVDVTKNYTKDSNNTKTVTIDKSGQTNDSNNTKTYKSNNTYTKESNKVEAEKGAAASVNGNAWNIKADVDVELEQETKNGSASSFSGDATVNKDSNNTKTYTKTSTKTVTIDKSGQTNTKQSIDDTEKGSAAAINGDATTNNTKTSTSNKTVTIDKSGSNNSKNYYKYSVDNVDLDGSITGVSNTDPSCCPTPNISVAKNFTAQNNGSFSNINGVINNNNVAGHFNNSNAYTNFTLDGGVANK